MSGEEVAAGLSLWVRMRAFWRSRVKPFWREYEVPVLIVVGIVAFAMGVVGFGHYFAALNTPRPPLDWVVLTIMMFRGIFLQPGPLPPELEVARWVAFFIAFYAAARILLALFYEQAHLLALRWLTSGHVVVCGFGEKGAGLAGDLNRRGYSVAIIEKNLSKGMAQKCKEEGAVILNGDATDVDLLRRARVDRAKYLVSALSDDGANAEVALAARELIGREGRKSSVPLTCYVHIVDRALCNLLKVDYEFGGNKNNGVRLEFFNVYDEGAKALLREYPPFGDKAGFAVVGAGELAESLVVRAATDWLFFEGRQGRRLSVVLIDVGASKKSAMLSARYPLLGSTCSISACDIDVVVPDARAPGLSGLSTVYVCLEKDSDCLAAALALRRSLNEGEARVVACMGHSSGLSKLVENIGEKQGYGSLGFFSLPESVAQPEVILGGAREAIAMAIHEGYVRAQQKAGIGPETNPSVGSWGKLPEDLKESNRHNADHMLVKLAAAGCGIELLTDAGAVDFKFSPEEVERMAVLEHERWCEERRRQGWTYAPGAKDIKKKTSPYLVPWEKLAEDIKEYDRNVARGMPVFLARAGFQVYRIRPAQAKAGVPLPKAA